MAALEIAAQHALERGQHPEHIVVYPATRCGRCSWWRRFVLTRVGLQALALCTARTSRFGRTLRQLPAVDRLRRNLQRARERRPAERPAQAPYSVRSKWYNRLIHSGIL